MEIKIDEPRVTASIEKISNSIKQVEVPPLNLSFSNNTVKVVEILPQQMNTLSASLQGLKDVGQSIAEDLAATKNAVVLMENNLAREIGNASLKISKEG